MTWRKYDPKYPPKPGQKVRHGQGVETEAHEGSPICNGRGVFEPDMWQVWQPPTELPSVGDTVRIPEWCISPEWIGAIGSVTAITDRQYGTAPDVEIEWTIPGKKGLPSPTWNFPNSYIVVDQAAKPLKVGDRVQWKSPPNDGKIWNGTIVEIKTNSARIRYDHYHYIGADKAHSHYLKELEVLPKIELKEGVRVRCTNPIATIPQDTLGTIIGTTSGGAFKVQFDGHDYYSGDHYHGCALKDLVAVESKKLLKKGDRVEWTASPKLGNGQPWVGTVYEDATNEYDVKVRYDHYGYITTSDHHTFEIKTLKKLEAANNIEENKTMGTPIAVGQVWKDGTGYTVKVIKIYDGKVDAEVLDSKTTSRKKGQVVVGFGITDPGGKTCTWYGWKLLGPKVEVGQIWQTGDWKVKITKIVGNSVSALQIGKSNSSGYKDGTIHDTFAHLANDGSGTFSGLDHWKMIEDVKKEEKMSKEETKETFGQMVKADFKDAAWRSASTQMTNAVQSGILAMLKDKGMAEDRLSVAKEILASEFGGILIRAALGFGLPHVPMLGEDERALRLAKEFRVSAIDRGMEEVMGSAMTYLMPALTSAMSALPPISEAVPNVLKGKKHRVASDADDVEEEEHEEVEEKKSATAPL